MTEERNESHLNGDVQLENAGPGPATAQDEPPASDDAEPQSSVRDELQSVRARNQSLLEENRRLRDKCLSTQPSRYRLTAVGFGAVGVLAGAATYFYPGSRELLILIAATGLFAALLTNQVAPAWFVPVQSNIGDNLLTVLSRNEEAVAQQLGVTMTQVYLPTDVGTRLLLPKESDFDPGYLRSCIERQHEEHERHCPLVKDGTDDVLGLSFEPSAAPLIEQLEPNQEGASRTSFSESVVRLTELVSESLELVDDVKTEVDKTNGVATFEFTEPAFGSVDQLDHVVVSFVGAGLAQTVSAPVSATVKPSRTNTTVVSYEW